MQSQIKKDSPFIFRKCEETDSLKDIWSLNSYIYTQIVRQTDRQTSKQTVRQRVKRPRQNKWPTHVKKVQLRGQATRWLIPPNNQKLLFLELSRLRRTSGYGIYIKITSKIGFGDHNKLEINPHFSLMIVILPFSMYSYSLYSRNLPQSGFLLFHTQATSNYTYGSLYASPIEKLGDLTLDCFDFSNRQERLHFFFSDYFRNIQFIKSIE